MGRNSKKKKRQQENNDNFKHKRQKKKQKRERFWIEDCRDTSSSDTARPSLEVLITQCQLFDDYRQVSQPKSHPIDINENGSEKIPFAGVLNCSQNLTDQKPNDGMNTKNNEARKESAESSENRGEKQSERERDLVNTKGPRDDSVCNFSNAFISIKRAKSANKPTRVMAESVIDFKPLPNGDCGDGIKNPYNNEEVPDKFWSQRRRLFSLFDEGIQMDKESWFSVTPEAIANHISTYLVGNRESAIILDPFCGCGGNAIAFARMERVKMVVCVDKDLEKLKMAASNAAIYDVPTEKMVFIHDSAGHVLSLFENRRLTKKFIGNKVAKNENRAEAFKIGGLELLPETIDCIFLSPPWGGIDYAKVGKRNYTLQCIRVDGTKENTEMNGEDILNGAAKALGHSGPIALFLPKNINGVALGRSVLRAGYSCPLVLEKNVLNGKLKTVTAYIGL